eukprot:4196108-Pleurochrysis_carterae.AAC.1
MSWMAVSASMATSRVSSTSTSPLGVRRSTCASIMSCSSCAQSCETSTGTHRRTHTDAHVRVGDWAGSGDGHSPSVLWIREGVKLNAGHNDHSSSTERALDRAQR